GERPARGREMNEFGGYREALGARVMRCSAIILVAIVASVSAAATIRAQPPLATDPAVLAGELSADELALRDPSSSEAALAAAAPRQQVAYRNLGRHPEWDATVRAAMPPSLVGPFDLNVDARRQLTALSGGDIKDTLPAWRIDGPPPADALLGYY